MTRMLEDLGTLLEQEFSACEKIRELAMLERQAVVAIEPGTLDAINGKLQSLLGHVGRMALQRLRLQEDLRREMNLPEDKVRLTDLVPHLPEAARAPLAEATDRLKGAYRDISRGIATNRMLMNEYVQTSRGFFRAMAGGDGIPTYSKRGAVSRPTDSNISFEQTA